MIDFVLVDFVVDEPESVGFVSLCLGRLIGFVGPDLVVCVGLVVFVWVVDVVAQEAVDFVVDELEPESVGWILDVVVDLIGFVGSDLVFVWAEIVDFVPVADFVDLDVVVD